MVSSRELVCGMNGCQRRFKTDYNLNKHRSLHSMEDKYHCVQCGKGFVERSSLSHHRRRHVDSDEKAAVCQICGKTFSRRSYLSQHVKCHKKGGRNMAPTILPVEGSERKTITRENNELLIPQNESSCGVHIVRWEMD